MTDGHSVAPGRNRSADSSDSQARRARYLQALAELSPHQAHDLRARLGSVGLHCELAYELLASENGGSESIERARAELLRARAGLDDAARGLETVIGLIRSRPAGRERFDLRDLVREIEAGLAAAFKGRRIEWSAQVPERAVVIEGDREALKQATIVAVLGALAGMSAGGRVELMLTAADGKATCAVESRPEPCFTEGDAVLRELTIAHIEFASHGGSATAPGPARLEFVLPLRVED
jgi:hypothetical protein